MEYWDSTLSILPRSVLAFCGKEAFSQYLAFTDAAMKIITFCLCLSVPKGGLGTRSPQGIQSYSSRYPVQWWGNICELDIYQQIAEFHSMKWVSGTACGSVCDLEEGVLTTARLHCCCVVVQKTVVCRCQTVECDDGGAGLAEGSRSINRPYAFDTQSLKVCLARA